MKSDAVVGLLILIVSGLILIYEEVHPVNSIIILGVLALIMVIIALICYFIGSMRKMTVEGNDFINKQLAQKEEKNRQWQLKNHSNVNRLMNCEHFNAHQKYIRDISLCNIKFIAIDAEKLLLMVGYTSLSSSIKEDVNFNIVKPEQVKTVSILNDAGDAISHVVPQSQSTMKTLGGAAAGAVAFGGAGAIVGAIAGSKTKHPTSEQLKEQAIKAAQASEGKRLFIGLNDLKNPKLEFRFDTGKDAKEWFNLIEIFINSKSDNKQTISQ